MPVELLAMPEEDEEQEKKSYPVYDVQTLENIVNELVYVFENGSVVTDTMRNLNAKQALRQTVTRSLSGIRESSLTKLALTLSDPKNCIKLNDERWFSMLPKASDLCYLSLSGRFDRKVDILSVLKTHDFQSTLHFG